MKCCLQQNCCFLHNLQSPSVQATSDFTISVNKWAPCKPKIEPSVRTLGQEDIEQYALLTIGESS